jgi:3-deoxy-D-manno-octulosonic-acid transferase
LRSLYTIFLYLLAPLVILRLAWRGLRVPGYWRRWPERFGAVSPAVGEQVIWIHAVSVGEVRAVVPVVRALLDRYQQYSLLVTTVTPTGSAQVAGLFEDHVAHLYAPWDLPGAVARFLDRVRPQLAIVMETELWPNLFHACSDAGIPLLLVNARLSDRSMPGYLRFRKLIGSTLAATTEILTQGGQDARRFEALGADRRKITVSGNLKFEQQLSPGLSAQAAELRREWGADRPVWIAGSTHEGEHELVLDAFRQVRKQVPGCLLVLVPRHPERFDAVVALVRQRGYEPVLRSTRVACTPETGVFIGDSIGELMLFYAAADVAFVGGSLVHAGGHNLLEPAATGIPVISGPNVDNFNEISDLLVSAGACRIVESTAELETAVLHWLQDPDARRQAGAQGREVVVMNRGALETVMMTVEKYL